jgi:PEGA domain
MKRLVLVVVLAWSASAAAQQKPSPQFNREYQAGIDAFRLGKYADARAHLEKAKAFDPDLPGPWRFLAAVDQAEQKWADCIAHARQAIKLNPQSNEIEATRKLHDACRAGAGRPAFAGEIGTGGAISVTANASGATVTLGGLKYGATPLAPRAVAVGEVEIGVAKTGWLPATEKVDVLPGVVTDVDFTLEPDPNAKTDVGLGHGGPAMPTTGFLIVNPGASGAEVALDGGKVAPDKDGRIEAEPGVHELTVEAPGYERWRRRVRIARGQKTTVSADLTRTETRRSSHRLGAIAVGTGAVLGLAAAGAAIVSLHDAANARDWAVIERSRPVSATGGPPLHSRARIESENDRAKKWALVSDVGYAAAAVSVGVGAYFLLRHRPRERAGAPPPFALAPVVGNGEIGVVMARELDW